MKKLRKVGKIAIPAVAIATAGAGSYMTYDKYGAQDNTLTLANVEALSKKINCVKRVWILMVQKLI